MKSYREDIPDIVVKTMEAGLRGEKLPNFGDLPPDVLAVVNAVYDAARNRNAGERIRATRVR
jgi:hypothetical protein